MSENHEHSGTARRQRLSLYAFKLVPVRLIVQRKALIRELLFGGSVSSTAVAFEINPVSGYISYRNKKELYRSEERKNLALPPTKEAATLAAQTFLAGRYRSLITNQLLQQAFANELMRGKPLVYPFAMIPPPQWLKHAGTFLVRNDKHDQPDHWLCKFQVQIRVPNGKELPVLNSSLDVRIGESSGGGMDQQYQVIGFQSRWRPVYDHYRVEQFLSDTGDPQHGPQKDQSAGAPDHVHVDEQTLLSYVLADENVPQFNLLPYEATVSGEHHVSILPASKDSLWVELRVRKAGGKYKVQALVMGGSGNYQAHWGFWDPFGYEFPRGGQNEEKQVIKG